MIDRSGNILGANLSARSLMGNDITEKNIDGLFNSNNFIEAVSKVLKKQSKSENLIFYVRGGKKTPNRKNFTRTSSNCPGFPKAAP